jgi:hypothetical protein
MIRSRVARAPEDLDAITAGKDGKDSADRVA